MCASEAPIGDSGNSGLPVCLSHICTLYLPQKVKDININMYNIEINGIFAQPNKQNLKISMNYGIAKHHTTQPKY